MLSLHEVEERLNIWGFHGTWHLGTVGNYVIEVNQRTMVMTWLTMALVIIFALLASRNVSMRRPNGWQNVLEMIYEFVRGLVHQNMDPVKGMSILSVVVTYFIFILFSNLLGLVPTLSSPTADYNTTVALALCTFALVHVLGIRYKGIASYTKHYFEPFFVFLPINLVEELSKPVTLAFRLYGNIYAGEVLIAVLLGLFPWYVDLFGGFIASVVWLAFSIFVGCVQAFIFTMLSIVYISKMTADAHDHH